MTQRALPTDLPFPGLLFTPLRRIPTASGEVRHGLRATDAGFTGFGEAYFSEVLPGATKGWKRHSRMTLNLIVVAGTIRFIIHDGATPDIPLQGNRPWDGTGPGRRRAEYVLSADGSAPYGRLTVPPGWWMAFQGLGCDHNLLLNLASHEHDPAEAESCALDAFADALPPPDVAPTAPVAHA